MWDIGSRSSKFNNSKQSILNCTIMKQSLVLIFFFTLFVCSKCDNENEDQCHKSISFINSSEKAVYVLWSTDYPDTLAIQHISGALEQGTKVSPKTESRDPFYEQSCWEVILSSVQIPSDTLMVFVFDADTVENIDWPDIVRDNKILHRYDLSLNDLIKSDWTISYPQK
jgi:hypothetical protein